ncbi:inositol-trisphosphate 3-kinase homolog [Saccostrea echinata]|uniref:inositol-trisphosphate 3-kinase homolog n=1 Tax=Saccostrea echinata TaxID=191078 RepID=UPI002A8317CE|nr:inositol-trisphosphate 3-kinase homolog [Saccostrea echinata]
MGCVHTTSSQADNTVKTLYLHRKLTRKSRKHTSGGQTNESEAEPTILNNPSIARNYSCGSVLSLDFPLEGKEFFKFPRWRGYKMCNVCDKDEKIDITLTMETAKHKLCNRCMMITEIRNNMQSCAKSKVSATAFANLLALTALDLSAPASDALVKNRKNAWIQLAGHPGAFAPAGPSTIWKRRINSKDSTETKAYEMLMKDPAHDIVPEFFREVEYNGEYFIEIEDLLQHFNNPNIMDIKIGKRTFMESEVKNPVLRKDLYDKMVKLCPDAPTPEEHKQQAITKLRYMQFREEESSTADYGFRIEALRVSGESPTTNLKKVKTVAQIENVLSKFIQGQDSVRSKFHSRLKYIKEKFESSTFLMSHQIIGSSILFMFDEYGNTGAWMIDFTKTVPIPQGKTLTHREDWVLGNCEDGYLFGVDSLIKIFENLDCCKSRNINTPHNQEDG